MNAKIGDVGHGANWAGFAHESSASTTGYALLQHADGKNTWLNKASGGGVFSFRVDNVEKAKITEDGVLYSSNFGNMGHVNWYGFAHPDSVGQNSYAMIQRKDGSIVNFNRTSADPTYGSFNFNVDNAVKIRFTGEGNIYSHNFNTMGHNADWYGFAHPDSVGPTTYAMLQHDDGLYTLINKKSGGGHIGFRVDNKDKVVINDAGNLGVGVTAPAHPIHVRGGAHVTEGGVWTNASSRALKDNIHDLSADSARAALASMTPVLFNYKAEPGSEYVGFIAEDMPAIATNASRDGVASMDVVAILTKVVQEQAKLIEDQGRRLAEQDQRLAAVEALN